MVINFEIDESLGWHVANGVLVVELSPQRALELWLELEDYLEEEGLVWE